MLNVSCTLAFKLGWTVEPVSLYDEDDVEGWCWTSPEGEEYFEVGLWDDGYVFPDQAVTKLTP